MLLVFVPGMPAADSLEQILDLFRRRGEAAYFGEPVSQLEHALQTARLAEHGGAAAPLIVAALLHDIGHLVHQLPESIADDGVNGEHEDHGAAWLRQFFGPDVTEPIRLHVDAKRYLCTIDAAYRGRLSPASQQSLQLQGGLFSAAERQQFEAQRYHRDAVQLRMWDDEAKVPGWNVPGLEYYEPLLQQVAAQFSAASNHPSN